jgi:P22 coat protein - gene protein 5
MSGNTLLTMADISDRATAILADYGALVNLVRREEKPFTRKVGETYSMRVAERVKQTTGRVATVQDIAQTYVDLTINQQEHQAWAYSVQELSLSLDNYTDLVVGPRASQILAGIEKDLGSLYTGIYNAAGTPGTAPNTFALYAAACQLLDDNGAAMDNRWMALNSAAKWAWAGVLSALATPNTDVPAEALTRGLINFTHDMQKGIHLSNGIAVHTNGAFGDSTPLANGSTADGATQLVTDGWASGTGKVAVGDIFTIGGVYRVHPETRGSTGDLMQFVVTTAVTATGTAMTISFSPTIHITGVNQNVDATPADNAAVTFKGSSGGKYPQNLVGIPDGIALAIVDQELPSSANGAKSDYKGVRLATTRGWDVINHEETIRMDVIYGRTLYQKEGIVRLYG